MNDIIAYEYVRRHYSDEITKTVSVLSLKLWHNLLRPLIVLARTYASAVYLYFIGTGHDRRYTKGSRVSNQGIEMDERKYQGFHSSEASEHETICRISELV